MACLACLVLLAGEPAEAQAEEAKPLSVALEAGVRRHLADLSADELAALADGLRSAGVISEGCTHPVECIAEAVLHTVEGYVQGIEDAIESYRRLIEEFTNGVTYVILDCAARTIAGDVPCDDLATQALDGLCKSVQGATGQPQTGCKPAVPV